MQIETARLSLLAAEPRQLESALRSNEALAQELGYDVAADWTEFGPAPLEYSRAMLTGQEPEAGWWTYFVVHRADKKVVGSGGYKGRPNAAGEVEIGYEICAAYRGQGLGTEIAAGLVQHARQYPPVLQVVAHTLAFENESTRILRRLGFSKTGELVDPEDGPIWRWELPVS